MASAVSILRRLARRDRKVRNVPVVRKGARTERRPSRPRNEPPANKGPTPYGHELSREPDRRPSAGNVVDAATRIEPEVAAAVAEGLLRLGVDEVRVLDVRDRPPAGLRWWPPGGGPPPGALYVLVVTGNTWPPSRTWRLVARLEGHPLEAMVRDWKRRNAKP